MLVITMSSQGMKCPFQPNCKCTVQNGSYVADCSNLGLLEFPKYSHNVTKIVFQHNNITLITSDDVLPSGLTYIDLSFCKLRQIDIGFFKQFPNLTYLDVSVNIELTLDVMSNITHDLQYTDIKVAKFNAIQCVFGEELTLKYSHICHLQNTSIKRLEFSSNRIGRLESGVIPSVPQSLRYVIAADNRFEIGSFLLEINTATNLEYLDIRSQYREKDEYTKLFDPACNDKRSQPCQKGYTGAHPLKMKDAEVNISASCLEEFIPKTLPRRRGEYLVYVCFPKSLNTLILSGSSLRSHDFFRLMLYDFRSLKIYRTDNNFRTSIAKEVFSKNCSFLDYSYNYLKYIDPVYFSLSNLSHLNLTGNYLGRQISENTSVNILKGQSFLIWLSFGDNDIRHIPHDFFQTTIRLQYLNLSYNRIPNITFDFRSLKQLRLLNLSHNNIMSLSNGNMKIFDLFANGQLTIDLSENDLLCSCETLQFLKWMNSRKRGNYIYFSNYESYFCTFPNSTRIMFDDIERMLIQLEKECSSYTGIIAGCIVASMAFLFSIITGSLYRYRWKLRYIYYMAKQTYKRNIKRVISQHDRLYRYDAFISYANEDKNIALQFKEEVEDKHGLKLCFHERDFVPGFDIAENIVSSIHESRKVVCIISNDFLKSHWCMYEFNMTNMERIHSRADDEESVFLVLLTDFDPKKAPLSLLQFIQENTYLEFPDDPTQQSAFWFKLTDIVSQH